MDTMPRPGRKRCFPPLMKPIQILIGLLLFPLLAGRVFPSEAKGGKYWFVSGRIESFPASGLVVVRTQTQQRRVIRYEEAVPDRGSPGPNLLDRFVGQPVGGIIFGPSLDGPLHGRLYIGGRDLRELIEEQREKTQSSGSSTTAISASIPNALVALDETMLVCFADELGMHGPTFLDDRLLCTIERNHAAAVIGATP
jgi:hypothetical protein